MLSYPQSLADQHNRRHHAELTEAGKQKRKAATNYDQDSGLHPGTDYCVKANAGTSWMRYPDIPSSSISVIRGSLNNAYAQRLLYS